MFVVVYLDDILVYSRTKEEHVQHVRKVLEAMKKADLRIKLKKSEFHKQEIPFLGYIVSSTGFRMDPGKIEAVTNWPTPKSVKEVQSFLGFANFYRRFIKDYSKTASPLTDLTKKGENFKWTEAAATAFTRLKELFTSQPILVMFEPESPITVETDASDGAIGACLSQPDDKGRLHPVAYYSRKLSATELNYEIHDKELLAIVDAFKHWRVYLEGPRHQVTVFIDHKNLIYFTTTKVLNRRQVRWSEELSAYNFKIHYRKGTENTRADALSRRTDYLKDIPKTKESILKFDTQGSITYNKKTLAATFTSRNEDLENEIKEQLKQDKVIQGILAKEDKQGFEEHQGLVLFEGLVYVPKPLRERLIKEHHDPPVVGYPGIHKTLERLTTSYYFPGMRKAIEEYIKRCDICQRTKHLRHKPYGLQQSPKTPDRAWKSIALDFITKLPKSKDPLTKTEYDSILVVTDRLTKYAYFIPYLESSTAEDLAYTFLRFVVGNHGVPEEIISDRDKLFTSKFWKALMEQLGVNHKLSTAYHPQTDGQTERINQVLEQYLRCYIDYR